MQTKVPHSLKDLEGSRIVDASEMRLNKAKSFSLELELGLWLCKQIHFSKAKCSLVLGPEAQPLGRPEGCLACPLVAEEPTAHIFSTDSSCWH